MRKRILPLLALLLVLLSFLQPPAVRAVTPLETGRSCSLSVCFSRDGYGFAGLETGVYRVAEASADGTFDLIAPFSGFPVNIHGITSQREWQDAADTLWAYISANQIVPDETAVSDETGTARFENLPTGLYLVLGATGENDSGIYTFGDFLIYLPTPLEDGSFDYDLEARPKPVSVTPKTEYRVTKLWKDSGASSSRPKSVTVDILKDGVLQETVVLNADNNWSHSWRVPEGDGKWTVVEKNVPKTYKVAITVNGSSFTITNTIKPGPDSPPETGDTFPLWPYIMAMCLSGVLLVIVGIWHKRRK